MFLYFSRFVALNKILSATVSIDFFKVFINMGKTYYYINLLVFSH